MNRNLFKNEKGSVLVLVAIAMTFIMGFSALAIDYGRVAVEKSKLQNAVDAAALAGAKKLPDTAAAIQEARDFIGFNGFDKDDFIITPSSDKLNITTKDDAVQVEYTLAKVIGFDRASVNAIAEAAIVAGSYPAAFDYAIFAGEGKVEFSGNGNKCKVEGNVYGKNGVQMGKKLEFSDTAKYYSGSASAGNKGTKVKLNSPLPMPTLDDIKKMIQKKGDTFNTSAEFEAEFNAGNPIKGPVCVAGTVDLSRVKGEGVIYADGFTGTISDANSSICLITNSSNLHFLGGEEDFYGIIYAPNADIHFSGAKKTIYGRLICKSVTFSGGKQTIIGDSGYGEEGLGTLFGSTVKLTR